MKQIKKKWIPIAVIITAIGTIVPATILIWDKFKPSEYRIVATGDYFDFKIPHFSNDDFEKFQKAIDDDEIEKKIDPVDSLDEDKSSDNTNKPSKKKKDPDYELKNEERSRTIRHIVSYLRDKFPGESLRNLNTLRSLWQFSIENTGSREITDLKLELPFQGYYHLIRSGENPKASTFANNIDIGSIRPANTLTVLVWAYNVYSPADAPKTRVTYPNGVTNIEYPTKVTGFLAWLAPNWNIFSSLGWWYFILVGFWIFILIVKFIESQKTRKGQEEVTETTTKALDKLTELKTTLTETEPSNEDEKPEKRRNPSKGFLD